MTRNRIPGLDGLRAVSIALVLFNHAGSRFTLAPYGVFGVSIFFVISGFIITWLMCQEEDRSESVSLRSFYRRRAIRILPPAFVFLGVVQLLGWLGFADVGPHDLFYCAAFVRNFLGSGIQTAHFWSLSIEEQFYLGWPLLFTLLRTNRSRLAFALGLFLLLPIWQHAVFVMHHGARFVNPQRFDMRCGFILAGCCLALARHETSLLLQLKALSGNATTVGWAALCVWAISPFFPIQFLAGDCAAIAVAMLVNSAVDSDGGILNWKPVTWIGSLSYSLYLWQQVFCSHPKVGLVGLFPLNVLASVALACASFYAIEKPLARFRSAGSRQNSEPARENQARR